MTRYNNLDILRIIAALMILSVHIGQKSGLYITECGAAGVQLFFILSGFLAMASYHNINNMKKYYVNRIKRLIPAYYVTLILLYCKDWLVDFYQTGSWMHALSGQCSIKFLRYFLFLQAWIPSDDYWMWNNHSALWTMSSFAFFYLLVPALYRNLNSFKKSAVALVLLLVLRPQTILIIEKAVAKYQTGGNISSFANNIPIEQLYCFIFGTTLYWSMREQKEGIYAIGLICLLLLGNFKLYVYEVIFTLFVMVGIQSEQIKGNPFFRELSKESFALYLIHPIVLDVSPFFYTWLTGIQTGGTVYGIVLYVLCFVSTLIVYNLIINPIEKFALTR